MGLPLSFTMPQMSRFVSGSRKAVAKIGEHNSTKANKMTERIPNYAQITKMNN